MTEEEKTKRFEMVIELIQTLGFFAFIVLVLWGCSK